MNELPPVCERRYCRETMKAVYRIPTVDYYRKGLEERIRGYTQDLVYLYPVFTAAKIAKERRLDLNNNWSFTHQGHTSIHYNTEFK